MCSTQWSDNSGGPTQLPEQESTPNRILHSEACAACTTRLIGGRSTQGLFSGAAGAAKHWTASQLTTCCSRTAPKCLIRGLARRLSRGYFGAVRAPEHLVSQSSTPLLQACRKPAREETAKNTPLCRRLNHGLGLLRHCAITRLHKILPRKIIWSA